MKGSRAKPADYEGFCVRWFEKRGFIGAKSTNFTLYGKHDWLGYADAIFLSPVGRFHAVQVTDKKHLKEHLEKYATKPLLKERIKALVVRGGIVELFICEKNVEGKPELAERYIYMGEDYPVRMEG